MNPNTTYPFNVAFRFGTIDPNMKHEDIVAFAHAAPWLCAGTDPDLHIEIAMVSYIAATDISVDLNVTPRPISDELSTESRKMGVKDPAAAQATAELLLWIAALRRIGDSPLQAAWNQWRASRGEIALPEVVPIILLEYNFGAAKSPPPPSPSLTLSASTGFRSVNEDDKMKCIASAPNGLTKVTGVPHRCPEYNDGPTQTST